MDQLSNSSVNNGEKALQDQLDRLAYIAYGIVAPLIIGIGTLGNVMNLIVLTRPNFKGATYIFLFWLAISDLFSLLFVIPLLLRLLKKNQQTYYSAWYHAHLELPLVNAIMGSSVLIVVALTMDRYISVCRPYRFRDIHTPQRAKFMILFAYFAAFVIYIPRCFGKEVVEQILTVDNETTVIYKIRDNQEVIQTVGFKAYLWIKEISVRIGPAIILGILNTLIIIAFRKKTRKKQQLQSNQLNKELKKELKKYREEGRLVLLLISVVILFFICMTPAAFLTIFNRDNMERNYPFQVYRAIANDLEFINYALNFYIYCLCSPEIRNTFLSLFASLQRTAPLAQAGSFSSSAESSV